MMLPAADVYHVKEVDTCMHADTHTHTHASLSHTHTHNREALLWAWEESGKTAVKSRAGEQS